MNHNNKIIELYDLKGKDDIRFSPPCWTVKLCMWHKQIQFKTTPVGFSEKYKIKFSHQSLVPVIKYKNDVVFDSWNIICWLDKNFSQKKLLKNDQIKSFAHFLYFWVQRQLQPIIFQIIGNEIKNILEGDDLDFFIKSREQRIGKPLSSLLENRDKSIDQFNKILIPIKKVLEKQSFLTGKAIGLPDFIMFGPFIWVEKCTDYKVFQSDEKLYFWYQSIKKAFGIK